ncbi:pentapeptide repeat-containing protein [Flavobacterium wongokense]|uniref:pentapeptide repeat-containing protein n=1 Tax=Flavobacterium wongokense TaxID=2910674 RepID=UPI001F2EC0AE|nr:pentapeptide repeat-containing protein [Flavobacterium sp. WG47]MCF6131295.1 hypothetical protein [Flavobacterium sp. WG47]
MVDLSEEIKNGRRRFENEIFHPISELKGIEDIFPYISILEFIKCEFNGFTLEEVSNPDMEIHFNECLFNDAFRFKDIYLNNLLFQDTQKITSVNISGKFTKIQFSKNGYRGLIGDIHLDVEIVKELNFRNYHHEKGSFVLTVNNGSPEKKKEFRTFFTNAQFGELTVIDSTFGYLTDFENIIIYDSLNFIDCTFEKLSFNNSKIVGALSFRDCIFNKPAYFQNMISKALTGIIIMDSKFHDSVNFNYSRINTFTLKDNVFLQLSYFQEIKLNVIWIHQTIFEKGALFDDIRINNIENCSRSAIRIIKQELQRAENRIDFNRFKNYEMATYYNELNWNNHFIDKSILYMTKISTDFGNSWIRALNFTLLSGFLFFSLLFITENYNNAFDLKNWTQFTSGFFRFFLVTDFYNPLETERVYLTNPLSWIIFIFGKIVIAFGIYEMIQSFRKFKA